MSNSLAHHHILWRNHWEIIIFGLKFLKYHTGIKYHYRLRGGKWQLNYVREGGLFSEWWWIQTYFPGLQKECSQEWRAETWVGMLMESFPWAQSVAAGKPSPEPSSGAAGSRGLSPSCRRSQRRLQVRAGVSPSLRRLWQVQNGLEGPVAARSHSEQPWLRHLLGPSV